MKESLKPRGKQGALRGFLGLSDPWRVDGTEIHAGI